MKVAVLGGDGFCGWPTALHLSKQGHEVLIIDNLSRRNIDNELECQSLTPIQPMTARLSVWHQTTGRDIEFIYLDVAQDYGGLLRLISEQRPDGYWEGQIHPVYVTACNLIMLQLDRSYLPIYQR